MTTTLCPTVCKLVLDASAVQVNIAAIIALLNLGKKTNQHYSLVFILSLFPCDVKRTVFSSSCCGFPNKNKRPKWLGIIGVVVFIVKQPPIQIKQPGHVKWYLHNMQSYFCFSCVF